MIKTVFYKPKLNHELAQRFVVLCFCFFMSIANGTSINNSDINTDKYVGSSQCRDCHKQQYQAWQGSHHDKAMQHASSGSVLANFNNASITFRGKQNRFFKKEAEFWVNIEGPDGQFHDYKIKYTFGYQPLQQYMVEFDDGRVQLIPFAWDSRSTSAGGQRWFHLYPEFTENHQEFFWTNTGQNWNYMCADCHSTDVKKNFDQKSNSYNTTFSEINVGCEACHGPASKHINGSQKPDKTVKSSGFSRNLSQAVTSWVSKTDRSTLIPQNTNQSQQVLVCAQCHSRHTQISNNDVTKSGEFGDRYMLSLINQQHYYPDGQVYDEDFVYGSFLQSKMHKNGVVCSNCHDPHSAKLTLPKEHVCLQCHQSQTYANAKHHHHPEKSTGAQCINCHMPETVYMQIDGRRDHSWQIPRPDFARQLGTPDVCLSCHQDKNSQWSENITKQWYPRSSITKNKHFAPVFAAVDQGYQQATALLSQIAQSNDYAPIIRASALLRMNTLPNTNSLIAIARAVKSDNANIRLGAINGAEHIKGAERWRIISPLLTDKVLVVRTQAAHSLMPLWQQLTQKQQQAIQPALDEYIEAQNFNADRGFAHNNKASVFLQQGRFNDAELAFKEAIRIEPFFAPSYLNLSELYRRQNKEPAAILILKQGLKAIPDNGQLDHTLGLSYIRAKQIDKAIEYLKQATQVAPENANFHYVYGLSLEKTYPDKAQDAVNRAYQLSNNPQYLYTLCEIQIRQNPLKAKLCLQTLQKVAPENIIKQLERQLNDKIKTSQAKG